MNFSHLFDVGIEVAVPSLPNLFGSPKCFEPRCQKASGAQMKSRKASKPLRIQRMQYTHVSVYFRAVISVEHLVLTWGAMTTQLLSPYSLTSLTTSASSCTSKELSRQGIDSQTDYDSANVPKPARTQALRLHAVHAKFL